MWPDIRLPGEIQETTTNPALVSDTEDGAQITRAKFTRTRRTWQLTWPAITNEHYATLREFYNSCLGSSHSFSWQHPLEHVNYTVRFSGDLTAQCSTRNFWRVIVNLAQV